MLPSRFQSRINFFFNRYAKNLERRMNEKKHENRKIEDIRNIQEKREIKTLKFARKPSFL